MPPSAMRPAGMLSRVTAIAFAVGLLTSAIVSNPAEATDNECAAGWVALTYDDGPRPERTDAILTALDQAGTRATFFSVGHRVAQYPEVALDVARRGHAVANHTWAHVDLRSLSDAGIVSSVQRTDIALRAIGIQPVPLVRPPFLRTDAQVRDVLEQAGFNQVMETVNSKDWSGIDPTKIVERVVTAARDGSVIGLHDGGPEFVATAAATEAIVARLTDDGFCFGVLNRDGDIVPPTAGGAAYDVPTEVDVDEGVWIDYLMRGIR
jgi:peptidoglycan/xylan/chitin deacetylase (PgdA/CDA1 family)